MNEESIQMNIDDNNTSPNDELALNSDKRKERSTIETRKLYKKEFAERNSMLTELYANKNFSTLYNLFVVATMYLIIINLLYSWRVHQTISFGFEELAKKFYKIEIALLVWLLIMILTVLTFPVFKYWANTHQRTNFKRIFQTFFILLFCVYSIGIQMVSVLACLQYDFSVVLCLALLLETLRMGMKSYAYIRTNAERVTTQHEFIHPTFKHFMYFLWCPTMVYRDSYPRTVKRSWMRVFKYLLEFLISVYTTSLVNSNFLENSFVDYGKSEVTLFSLFVRWMEITLVVSLLFYFYGFYMLQHLWMNMFAELLYFGDRAFYKDWWSAKSMKEYYCRWSLLVHEWLYEYIYFDLYNNVTRKSFTISSLATVIISAIVHEYVVAISLKFFVPVLLVLYLTLGILYMYIELGNRIGNIFVWFNLVIGMSLMVLLYFMEFYARINCGGGRPTNVTLAYYYTPMILTCKNILIK